MFGYIRPFKPEMKFKDFEAFQSVYCGLCHALGGTYHILARLILSYDATFLAILKLALDQGTSVQPCCGKCSDFNDSGGFAQKSSALFKKKRCPFKPLSKKRAVCISPQLAFAADVSVLLFYYKLKDTVQDSGLFKRLSACLLLPFASLLHKKAAKRQPELQAILAEYIRAQSEVEVKRSKSIDEAAHPTGQMLAALAAYGAGSDASGRILRELGYHLGRWVYLMDAADDLKDDRKSGNYNPFIAALGGEAEGLTERIDQSLNPCIYQVSAAFELLSVCSFEPVIRNIIYFGLPQMQKKVVHSIAYPP